MEVLEVDPEPEPDATDDAKSLAGADDDDEAFADLDDGPGSE